MNMPHPHDNADCRHSEDCSLGTPKIIAALCYYTGATEALGMDGAAVVNMDDILAVDVRSLSDVGDEHTLLRGRPGMAAA